MNLETTITRDLWAAVRRSYESELWSNAILDGVHYLSDAIRLKTGLQSDGYALAGQALGGKSPKLRLNKLQTESEQNIQAGVEQLLRGLYQAVRNPRSHGRVEDSRADAEAIIAFIDYLLRVVGHARAAFSLGEYVARVLEENFVPNQRYASLLVEEIPARQRLQVAIAIYQGKAQSEGSNLKFFFEAIFTTLTPDEMVGFFAVVSEELRESSDEATLRSTMQVIQPEQWQMISEVARLRSENRIIRNLREGRYLAAAERCQGGALATWSTGLWKYFGLKTEIMNVLLEKLSSSSVESQDYVLKFAFRFLDTLAEKPPSRLQSIIQTHLHAGDIRFKEAVDWTILWDDALWNEGMKKALQKFLPSGPALEDDDIPF